MSCRDCDGLCRQGRDCPHRVNYWEMIIKPYMLKMFGYFKNKG